VFRNAMSEWIDKTNDKIKDAYARTDQGLAEYQKPLPRWDDLPSAVREAFINVFFAGRRDALEELEARAKERK
jgi:DNA-binding PadR family transcriptional regulator